MGNAESIEERSHHRPLVLEVIRDDEPGGQQVRDLEQAGQVLGPLVEPEGQDALRAGT